MRPLLTLVIFAIFTLTVTAKANERSDWFKSLKQPGGTTSCCDVSDCHDTVALQRNGHWFARNRHHILVPIPPEKVLTEPLSIDGEAYLCESNSEPATIYCFIPPIPGF